MFCVRPARFPDDKPAILDFVWGLQRYEAAFEPDRRLDDAYGEDQFAYLMKNLDAGAVFLAELGAKPAGWVMVYEHEAPPYVVEAERRAAIICELYVEEAMRGQGIGRALIAAAEDWARAKGLGVVQIGHLAENRPAARSYEKAGFAPYVVLRRKRL